MGTFLRQLWPFIAPHRGRLIAGALSGLLYGLGSALLLLAVKLVLEAIFPTEGARDLAQSLGKLPALIREPLMSAMESRTSSFDFHFPPPWVAPMEASTPSTSDGYTFSPPLMIMLLLRSTRWM